jgi:hypothetical protein|uniref:Uncharacterized protein n=1 Tax=Podoviridae sp. ctZkC8 TaxID=2825259 RepID=A0A8S5UBS0_9CAUD|nr:MAG TPA: hypothetical protein [Podoviridae sp. ctZkC8]
MEDFIIFSNTCGGRTLVRKSAVVSVHEDDVEGEINVSTNDADFMTSESFDSIISKLTK